MCVCVLLFPQISLDSFAVPGMDAAETLNQVQQIKLKLHVNSLTRLQSHL